MKILKIPIVPTLKPYYIESITAGKFYRSSLTDSYNYNYDKRFDILKNS